MLLSKKVEDQLILILDVQSSLVGGSLVVISENNLPRIIFSHTVNIAYDPKMENAELIKATLLSIKEIVGAVNVSLHARKKAEGMAPIPKKISSVHYVLSSPWIVSEAKAMKLGFEKDKIITKKFISDLISDDRSKIVTSDDEALEVIEQKIFDVRLNGYSVGDWENKSTRSLEVSFTVSVAGSKMVELFIEEVRPFVHRSKVNFHSSLLLQYITIEKALTLGLNYCLIHAHGDYTDIFIVHEKSCVYFGTYPIGVRTILSEIGAKTSNHKQAADSLLSLYMNYKKSCELIEGVIGDWVNGLKTLLVQSKVEIKPSLSMVLNSVYYDECLVKTLRKLSPEAVIALLSLDELLPHVIFEENVTKSRIGALEAVAIHSLLV
jgi:hypothetical protein